MHTVTNVLLFTLYTQFYRVSTKKNIEPIGLAHLQKTHQATISKIKLLRLKYHTVLNEAETTCDVKKTLYTLNYSSVCKNNVI